MKHGTRTGWFKSSYSNASGSCVEARHTSDATLVRDSKNRQSDSPVIKFTPIAWASFLDTVTEEGCLRSRKQK